MKIQYLCCDGKHKLFSFYRHDYQVWEDSEKNHYMIDGGISSDPSSYGRYSRPNIKDGLQEDEISNLIQDIREQFTWGKNYDKDKNRLPKTKYALLKNLETGHIFGILKYFTEKLDIQENILVDINTDKPIEISWKIIHLIFLEELIYREKNDLL